MESLRSKVVVTALYSRLFVYALSVVANLIIPDHDAGKRSQAGGQCYLDHFWRFSPIFGGFRLFSPISNLLAIFNHFRLENGVLLEAQCFLPKKP
jgi:hypothetical protein